MLMLFILSIGVLPVSSVAGMLTTRRAGCTSPGPSTLLSAMSCETVDLCGNCDKHGGAEMKPSSKVPPEQSS